MSDLCLSVELQGISLYTHNFVEIQANALALCLESCASTQAPYAIAHDHDVYVHCIRHGKAYTGHSDTLCARHRGR